MIQFSFGAALMSATSGVIVTRTGEYRPVMWIAFAVFAVGYGLMIMLDAYSSTYVNPDLENKKFRISIGLTNFAEPKKLFFHSSQLSA
jgi:hypothetical protein